MDLEVVETLIRTGSGRQASDLPERIEAVVYDFDGVLTDNRVTVSEDGSSPSPAIEATAWGSPLPGSVGSSSSSLEGFQPFVVTARCRKLKIGHPGEDQGGPALRQWMDEKGASRAGTTGGRQRRQRY